MSTTLLQFLATALAVVLVAPSLADELRLAPDVKSPQSPAYWLRLAAKEAPMASDESHWSFYLKIIIGQRDAGDLEGLRETAQQMLDGPEADKRSPFNKASTFAALARAALELGDEQFYSESIDRALREAEALTDERSRETAFRSIIVSYLAGGQVDDAVELAQQIDDANRRAMAFRFGIEELAKHHPEEFERAAAITRDYVDQIQDQLWRGSAERQLALAYAAAGQSDVAEEIVAALPEAVDRMTGFLSLAGFHAKRDDRDAYRSYFRAALQDADELAAQGKFVGLHAFAREQLRAGDRDAAMETLAAAKEEAEMKDLDGRARALAWIARLEVEHGIEVTETLTALAHTLDQIEQEWPERRLMEQHFSYAALLAQSGQRDAAMQRVERVTDEPQRQRLLVNVVTGLARGGDIAAAEEVTKELQPEWASNVYETLAEAKVKHGMMDGLEEWAASLPSPDDRVQTYLGAAKALRE
jgi:hypothetical protein